MSTEPLEERPGDIMLSPEVVEFASDALASLGGRYTGEIEFSGRSARVARRMSSSAHIIAPQVCGALQAPFQFHLKASVVILQFR